MTGLVSLPADNAAAGPDSQRGLPCPPGSQSCPGSWLTEFHQEDNTRKGLSSGRACAGV